MNRLQINKNYYMRRREEKMGMEAKLVSQFLLWDVKNIFI